MVDDDAIPLLTRDFDFHTLVPLRHQVERCLARVGMPERQLYLFVVAINEVTTNAVRHGGGEGRMYLWRAPLLDDYAWVPQTSALVATNGSNVTLTDTNVNPQSFYRVLGSTP